VYACTAESVQSEVQARSAMPGLQVVARVAIRPELGKQDGVGHCLVEVRVWVAKSRDHVTGHCDPQNGETESDCDVNEGHAPFLHTDECTCEPDERCGNVKAGRQSTGLWCSTRRNTMSAEEGPKAHGRSVQVGNYSP
jgi:hypothetical protein